MEDPDRTASLMTPAQLAQVKPQGPVSPAAWLDQMAADAGHQHVKRIGELREILKSQGKERDLVPLTDELSRLGRALPKLDFGLLQNHGLWARLSGKSRSAGAEFTSQFTRLEEAAGSLASQVQALQKQHKDQTPATDLALLEVEVEFKAIEKLLDQGARWLQDMRNQLKVRQAQVSDEAAQKLIEADTLRCEILVARLKLLRAVSSAAQHAHQQAQIASDRRAGLGELLREAVDSNVRDWRRHLEALVAAMADPRHGPLKLDAAMESHRELQLFVKQAGADCAQLHSQEKVLAESLSALRKQLDGAKS